MARASTRVMQSLADAAAQRPARCMCRPCLVFAAMGIPTVDYGSNIRQVAFDPWREERVRLPRFRAGRLISARCSAAARARSAGSRFPGDPEDIAKTDAKMKELFPEDKHLHRWLDMASERIAFQGLPARICWIGLGERQRAGLAFNEMVKRGELKAPIVIGRDHLDSGSVASPNRETEAMMDGSDAVSDWPLLNALLNTAGGATWVSLHHGGGVGMGYSQHSGVVIVCDGTDAAAKRIERVLWNDPATGVMRHADAGYEDCQAVRPRMGTQAADACRLNHNVRTIREANFRTQCRRAGARRSTNAAWRRRHAVAAGACPRRHPAKPRRSGCRGGGDAPVYGVNTGFGSSPTSASTRLISTPCNST